MTVLQCNNAFAAEKNLRQEALSVGLCDLTIKVRYRTPAYRERVVCSSQ